MRQQRSPMLLYLLLVPGALAARGDYCKENTFTSNSTYMQYNKELVEAEFAVHDQFKAIHCCGKGYRSIEWFKDGVAYPWSSGVSNLILYPEAANQTLYTQRAGSIDAGNYTCRMSNDTHHLDHTVALQVTEMPADTPRATVIPGDKHAELGSDVRFYCEAFVGRMYLPDAHTDIKWRRVRSDGERGRERAARTYRHDDRALIEDLDRTEIIGHNVLEIQTKRESEDIVGAYLYISRVLPEDYGQYVCTVRSNDVVSEMPVTLYFSRGPVEADLVNEVPWRGLVLATLLVSVALLSAFVLYSRCWPRVALATRRFQDTAPLSEKEYDVLVVYTAVDWELTRGALLQTLQLKYHYRTTHLQLTTQPDTWYSQIIGEVDRCRSLVCVMSPTQHSPAQLLTALKQLRALPLNPVIVLLQDLPKLKREAKDEHGDSLISLLRRTKLLAWRYVQDRAFWTNLRLALPPPAPRHARCFPADPQSAPSDTNKINTAGLSMEDLACRAKPSRSDSLDALV